MNPPLKKLSIAGLRWTLGLVVLWESVHFVFSSSTIHHLAKAGFPQWIRHVLGGSEIIAVLFYFWCHLSAWSAATYCYSFLRSLQSCTCFTASSTSEDCLYTPWP